MPKILFIDDEAEKWKVLLEEGLEPHGFVIVEEELPEKAIYRIKKDKPDVVLLDILFHGIDKGKSTLASIKKFKPELPVIMITTTLVDVANPEDYPGASYFFAKQEINPEKYDDPYAELARQLNNALNEASTAMVPLDERLGFIVGNTQRMRGIAEQILQVAPTNVTVLIRGESGTGKELVARAIHENSQRSQNLFYSTNITVVPSREAGLALMDKLFGHARRQPPWNDNGSPGIFENAAGGTVFLDEMGNASQDIQKGLLRVLQERVVERIGSHVPVRVDVRIISATNQKLEEKITDGSFREDLYYRLKVVEITLPPLRERITDIPALYVHFIDRLNRKLGKQISAEKPREDVLKMFQKYPWPGNIRQFENVLEDAMVRARSNILTPGAFNLTSNTGKLTLSINISETIHNLMEGKTSWDDLKDIHGDTREQILLSLIELLMEKNKKRPKSSELAQVIKTSEGNVRRILSKAGISLRRCG